MELLKAGSDVNKVENEHGLSPLHLAIQEGHERIVELLINFGSNLSYKSQKIGLNALELASKLGKESLNHLNTIYEISKLKKPFGNKL